MDPKDETTNDNGANELLAIESAIKTRILQSQKLKEELKAEKEMLKSMLENDPEYLEKEKTAKAATKDKTAAKQKVINTPEGKALNQKVKDLSNEAKDVQEGLSYYLREYQIKTGANQFENQDGEVLDIVYVAKLVRRSTSNQ